MLQLSSIIRRIGFILTLTLQLSAFSQSNYTFAPSVGTYSSISGTEVTSILSNFTPINIGFTFKFDGIDYTQVVPSRCGWLSFNTGITTSMGNNDNKGDLTNAVCRPLIGGLFADNGQPGSFRARYTVTGTAPNRVFIFEWYYLQWHWYTANYLSLEIKLYETSNKIECIYNPISNLDTYYCCTSIGLAFANAGEFLSLSDFSTNPSVSNTSESHDFNSQPTSGLTYTFTPIPAKPEPTNQCTNLTSTISADNIILNWTDATGGTLPDGYLILASKTNSFSDPIDGTNITEDNDLTDGKGAIKVLKGIQSCYGWKNAESSTNYYFKIYAFTNGGTLTNFNTTSAPTTSIKLVKSTPLQHVFNFQAKNNSGNYVLEWTDAKKFGNSILFYSSNSSYIDCGNGSSLNITGNSITLEAWVKPNVALNDIFQKENSGLNGGYKMYSNEFGQVCFSLYINSSWSEVKSPINTFVNGNWSHICGTYDGTTQKIFINGNLVASKSTTGSIFPSSTNLFIGKSHTSTFNYYNGKMDEMSIWSTARSQSDILNDMNLRLTGTETGLVAYYKCNQGIADANNIGLSTLLDATPYANNATLEMMFLENNEGDYSTSNTNSDIDGYLILASSTNTFPSVVNGTDIATDNDLADGTGAVKVAQGLQTYGGWTNIDASKPYYFRIIPFSNKASEIVYNTSGTIPQVSIKPKPTNHVTNLIASSANGNIVLNWTDAIGTQLPDGYILLASTSPIITTPVNGTEISIDNDLSNGTGAVKVLPGVQTYSGFTGFALNTVYYFNIYPYTNENTLISYKTDETVPQTSGKIAIYTEPTSHASAFTANSYGTLTLSWIDAPGMPSLLSNALNFDGSNDLVTCSGSQNTSVFSAEAWFSTGVTIADMALVSTLNEGAGSGFELHVGINGKPVITLRNSSTWLDVVSPNVITANKWTHVAATYDGATVKLYVDGQLMNSAALPAASFVKGTSPLVLGRRSSGLLFFNGSIDEVRIWNIARSQVDIQNNMNNELNGTETGLLSYYKFNQGTAGGANGGTTTLTDATANAFYGTLSGFALTGVTSNWINPGQAPTGYLIKASTTNSFTDPVDGTEITTDNDLSDGAAVVKVSQGTQIYSSFAGTKGSTNYYFKMWPYTNSGNYINYRTAATVPTASIAFAKTKPITHVTNLAASNNNKVINVSWIDAIEGTPSFGNTIDLDGINDFVAVPTIGSSLSKFTIETWFKASSLTGNFSGIYNNNSWVAGAVHFQINNGNIELAVGGGAIYTIDVSYAFAANTWYHLAATYNAGAAKIYVNGTLVGSGTLSTTSVNLAAAQIGAWNASRFYAGKFDEYRIWNTERTLSDIFNNMFSELTGSESGLIAYYKFNQGTASGDNTGLVTVTDASSNAKNGTLTNFALTGTSSNWVSTGDIGRRITSPDGYLIKVSKNNNITAPTNGSAVADDNNLADGVGAVNILAGVQTYNGWADFTDTTAYYYKVYPYSNSGTSRVYNTSVPVPVAKDSVEIDRFKEISTSILDFTQGTSAWADYDGNGLLDVLVAGGRNYYTQPQNGCFQYNGAIASQTILYKQITPGVFSPIFTFPSVVDASISWADYNNDGLLDFIITGRDNSGSTGGPSMTKLFKQITGNTFTEVTNTGFVNINGGSVSWADYDNDGDLDVIITGGNKALLYRNNGGDSFTEMVELPFMGVTESSVAWGDYNNDGYLDLLLTGYSNDAISNGPISKVYRNRGDGFFTEQTSITLPGITSGTATWIDYDNNGNLDISLSGHLFKNNGNGSFESLVISGQDSLGSSSCSWGDYNNDGRVDFAINGVELNSGNRISTELYEQTSEQSFTLRNDFNFLNLTKGSSNLIDYNNDGNLDLFLTGEDKIQSCPSCCIDFLAHTRLYKNTNFKKNTKPSTPTGLVHSLGQQQILSWNPAADAETPTKGLTYNIRIGTTKYGKEIVSPMSLASGIRMLPAMGNCQLNTFAKLNLKVGRKYYWSVQAVDNGNMGGSFSSIDSLTVDSIPASHLSLKVIDNTSVKATWQRGNGNRCAVFCKMKFADATIETAAPVDGTQYIGVDKFRSGPAIGSTGWYCVYNGIEDSVIIRNLEAGSLYSIHVIEYLDEASGPVYYNLNSARKDNYGIFNTDGYLNVTTGFGTTCLADFNKDGYVDVMNLPGGPLMGEIKINNGNNSFTALPAFNTPIPVNYSYVQNLSVACGDYDNDGHMDIVVSGEFQKAITYEDSAFTKIYKNQGNNTFIEQSNVNITGVYGGSVAWGDYDNDGDLDLLICGETECINCPKPNYPYDNTLDTLKRITQVYVNNSTHAQTQFDLLTTTNFVGVGSGSGAWADFDNDGYLDFAVSGLPSISRADNASGNTAIAKVYHNNKNGTFSPLNTNINGGYKGDGPTVFWADYDNDGDLDIKVEGPSSSSGPGTADNFRILINNFPEPTLSLSNNPVPFYKYDNKVDYDNDGDLDIIDANIQRNNDKYYPGNFASNKKPAKPINLKYVNLPGYVQLIWDNIISDETPFKQMSYNIRLRKEGNSQWLCAPQSMNDGSRQIPNFGNIPFKPNGYNNFARYNLPEGNYEWQVQAIDGSFSSSEWSEVNTFTVKAALASFTADSVCLGDTTIFIDNSFSFVGIKEWRWDFGDTPTVTGKVQKHVFQTTGDHNVRLIITNNNLQNDTVYGNAFVKPIPSVSFTVDDVCEGLTATIINPANTDGLIDWIWDFGDGSTSNYFNPGTHTYAEKKNYTIKFKVTGENNCSSTATRTIAIKERPAKPTISESINNFCPGTEVKLEVTSSTNGFNFQWKRNGDIVDGATSKSYTGKLTAADYSAVVEPGSCSSESNKLTIVTKPAPPKPNILGHGPTIWILACDNMTATGYKWYYNNNQIPGANGYQYYANKNYGDYYVSINNGGECWTPSDVFKTELANGIDDLSYNNVKVFPNPSEGLYNVSLGSKISGVLNVKVVNALGNVVLSQIINNSSDFAVDISTLTNGIYFISISNKDEVIIKKVVKQ